MCPHNVFLEGKSALMKGKNKTEPPHGMKLYTGSSYITATRDFMNWAMKNSTAQIGIHGL